MQQTNCYGSVSYTHLDVYKRQVWFSCMDIVITGEKIQYIFRKMPKAGIIFSMILRFLPMYMRKYERMKMINDINNKSSRNSKDNAVFVFSGVTSYAMESSMETVSYTHLDVYKRQEVFGRTKEVFFEYNRGGHFTDISERIAKSILTEIS